VARVRTVAFAGVETPEVEAQVSLVAGLPVFAVVGLPDKAVGESRERIRAALSASGLAMPQRRVVVNLAPADVAKEGSHYDLPIAMALLAAMGEMDPAALDGVLALGELGLDGRVAPAPGVLPAAAHCLRGGLRLVCPAAQSAEADRIEGVEWMGAASLERVSAAFAKSATFQDKVLGFPLRAHANDRRVQCVVIPQDLRVDGRHGERFELQGARAVGCHQHIRDVVIVHWEVCEILDPIGLVHVLFHQSHDIASVEVDIQAGWEVILQRRQIDRLPVDPETAEQTHGGYDMVILRHNG